MSMRPGLLRRTSPLRLKSTTRVVSSATMLILPTAGLYVSLNQVSPRDPTRYRLLRYPRSMGAPMNTRTERNSSSLSMGMFWMPVRRATRGA